MNKKADSTIKTALEHRIEELKAVPERDPLRAASGRARFLREAEDYRKTISPEANRRQKGWTFPIRKEKLSMNALVSLILVAFLLVGGGATVAAAQDDLPTQPLYQLKLWTENATLALNVDPQGQADLLMDMTQTRLQEMAALTEMGVTPPDQVRERLQQHLDRVLQLAVDMDEGTRDQVLLQLRDQLQTEDQIIERLQLHLNAESEPQLSRTREVLRTHLQLVDQGLVENQMRHGQDEEMPPGLQQQGEPGSQQNNGNGRPADPPGNGNGNPNENKPQNGNSNGGPGGQNPGNQQGGNSQGGDGGNK